MAGVAARDQRWAFVDCSVAIDAVDGGRVARLAVKHAVAVHIEIEMAIPALHPFGEVHILQMDRLGEFVPIVVVDLVVLEIEQIAFAIVFENRTEDPAMSVIIGELGVLELRIEFRNAIEKILVAP